MVDFRYPLAFVFYFLLGAVLLYRWLTRGQRLREMERWGDEKVRNRLFSRINPAADRWKQRLRWWAIIILIFALSGPQIGTKLVEVKRQGVDIIVALDISSSMTAEDVKPNRLEKAKFEISRLIGRLKGDRIGIIVFAGTSHLYLPLTGDYAAAELFVDAVDSDLIQTQGTALADALEMASSSFPEESEKYRVLVVVTDGEDHEGRAVKMAKEAVQRGVIIHTVGVGTVTGSLIPVFSQTGDRIDYKKDRKGKLVTSILNEPMLNELAMLGGGVFVRFDNRGGSMEDVLEMIHAMEKRTLKTHEYSQFEDRYQIFLACALVLFTGILFIPSRKKGSPEWRGRFV
ncbi:MAG: VWA domain-containing protein [Candidatus Marinimicrobia bacterium]|nr:hypothetical protein [Candidatus Neomarinimicrobiota bacterium]MDP6456095.1 VWA domain-containing protein [Candidatus Neomarinimicrobiota bacterium]MDP6592879.1 VWA domain-containing protein [Candidatus Neomarinimicrobiota bacterium]MDP6836152.1 VWA domain-containing protein [Candidatus Neomarinimicrobiota bacterium]